MRGTPRPVTHGAVMRKKILTEQHDRLLAEERSLLGDLQMTLARHEADHDDQKVLERSVRQLDEMFLLVVAGEFNSGKSAFINALLGDRVLEEGVTPTTSRIHTIAYGPHLAHEVDADGIQHVKAPIELLREVEMVDTPGTNALDREHEAITQRFIPRSDLVLFVTSADRAFTESERAFIEKIRSWGKKLVFIINKADLLRTEDERLQIERFVAENAERLLGFSPDIFSVSARMALEARLAGQNDGALMKESRFPALETYLAETLDQRERVRLKLLNPLGVGLSLADKYRTATQERLDILADDIAALDSIEHQLDHYREDLGHEFSFRLTDVDGVLHDMEKRGHEFLDETVRIGRIFDLIKKTRVKEEFERKVVADAPAKIEEKVDGIIDWMVNSELRQWQTLNQYLAERRAHHAGRVIGNLGNFDNDRKQLLDTIGRAAQRTADTYEPDVEAARLADSVQNAVAGLAVVEVGAVGLGATVAILASTTLVDVTGILAAGFVAAMGLFILPARRARAKTELSKSISALNSKLREALEEQFDHESERSLLRIREAVAPYTRFVRAERDRFTAMREQIDDIKSKMQGLRQRLEEL